VLSSRRLVNKQAWPAARGPACMHAQAAHSVPRQPAARQQQCQCAAAEAPVPACHCVATAAAAGGAEAPARAANQRPPPDGRAWPSHKTRTPPRSQRTRCTPSIRKSTGYNAEVRGTRPRGLRSSCAMRSQFALSTKISNRHKRAAGDDDRRRWAR
jgi:hypothetical protein